MSTNTPTSTGTVTETPAPQVWPSLRARDARALIDFHVAAFGFTEVVAYTDDEGAVVHAELSWPLGGGVMLGQDPGDGPDERHRALRPGTFGGYVVCDEGNRWQFGTYRGHPVTRPA